MLGKQGHPEAEWMLVAYNWGIDKVLKHLEAGLGWDELPPESRQYVQIFCRLRPPFPRIKFSYLPFEASRIKLWL